MPVLKSQIHAERGETAFNIFTITSESVVTVTTVTVRHFFDLIGILVCFPSIGTPGMANSKSAQLIESEFLYRSSVRSGPGAGSGILLSSASATVVWHDHLNLISEALMA